MSSSPATRKIKLNTGALCPIIGTGSFGLPTGHDVPTSASVRSEKIKSTGLTERSKKWLLTAFKVNGYRHVDTGVIYQTERAVGQAISESGIPREEFFVTTKIPWNHFGRVAESFDQSLKDLGLEYVDLYLIHWPGAMAYEGDLEFFPQNADGSLKFVDSPTFHDAWAGMEKIYKSGRARAIGVSNFSIKTLEELAQTANVIPAVNQVELHPYLAQNELREYCAKKGIIISAYTPSGYAVVRNDPLILELAKKYNATSNQIIFAWHLSRDTVIVCKSERDDRQKENIAIPTLEAEDLAKISALDRGERICNKPDENGMMWGWTTERLGW